MNALVLHQVNEGGVNCKKKVIFSPCLPHPAILACSSTRVSDFANYLDEHRRILRKFGVSDEQLHLDGRATVVVTNFTSLVDDFVDAGLQHVYLITSDYHMGRARVIATVVLGSRGVVVTPIAVDSGRDEDEALVRVVRDFGRSFLWVLSGRTGASLNPRLD